MTPVIVIRPQPGCDASVAAARAMGMEAHGFPLFAAEPLAWEAPDPASFDALLIGSANALRHGGPALARYAGKPAYAVGEATARAARDAGLDVVAAGSGGLQAMLDCVRPDHARLLRLAGRERVELSPPAGLSLTERVVYASKPLPIPDGLAALLARPSVVLLHSAEAARHFARECARAGLARTHIALAAIAPRAALAAGEGWAAIAAASSSDDKALLALARDMCQTGNGSKRG